MIKISSGRKRLFLVTFFLNLLLLILYNSLLNVNVLMEKKLAQSTMTTNEFNTSFPIFINNLSSISISKFSTSSFQSSNVSVAEACVYSIPNKSN